MDHYDAEKISNWAGDFCEATAFGEVPAVAREHAPSILEAFLTHAAETSGALDALDEAAVRAGLLDGVSALNLPADVHAAVPDVCAAFLESLGREGRLGGGPSLARFTLALRGAYADAARGRPASIDRPGAKLGRNDPCPCGSGKKYKKCCMGGLG